MRIGPKDGSRARPVVVRRCRSADKGQRARVRVDGECRNLTGVLLHCIKKISGRADNNEPRTIAGGNRRTHHGEAAGIGVNGEYGDVIGNNIADVSEAPGGLTAMTRGFVPPLGTVPLRFRWPVCGSTA